MKGSQEPLLFHSPSVGSSSLSSYDFIEPNKDMPHAVDGGYKNDYMLPDECEANMSNNSSFSRRRSVQFTNHLQKNSKFDRRGSMSSLSASAQNSPVVYPKKSHTAPNPFPELINSPPPTPSADHRRSRSSNMDDRLWLTPEELSSSPTSKSEGTGVSNESHEETPVSSPPSQTTDYLGSSSSSSQLNTHGISHSRLKNGSSFDYSDRLHGDTHSKSIQRNSSLDQKYTSMQPYTCMFNGHDYTGARLGRDRVSPTNSTGRLSPESDAPIYDEASALVTPNGFTKQMIKVYTDEKNSDTVTIDEQMKSVEVCRMIVRNSGRVPNISWSLAEVIPKFDLERSLEDHELVYAIYRSWSSAEHNRFKFVKDPNKYDIFQNAVNPFPPHMLDSLDAFYSPKNSPKISSKSNHPRQDRQASILLQNLVCDSDTLPDIQSIMHVKDSGRKTWKKHFFVLRKSGLYYSTKGTSKDPKHLVLLSSLSDVNVYIAKNAKKRLGAPNNFCFCLKGAYRVSDVKDLRLLCAEDDQSKLSWVSALRLIKYGSELRENFRSAIRHEAKLQSIENREGAHRHLGKMYPPLKSRVAMDFTGLGGRVVQDPNEALGVAIQESQHLRKKAQRTEAHAKEVYKLHMTQPWFHSSICREEAVHAIHNQGMCDGVFLVRESQSLPGCYVLSMAHGGKVKHCTIKAFEFKGKIYYSMDGEQTKFLDLIQLVEFYQINANGLPCRLTDYVSTV